MVLPSRVRSDQTFFETCLRTADNATVDKRNNANSQTLLASRIWLADVLNASGLYDQNAAMIAEKLTAANAPTPRKVSIAPKSENTMR